MIRPLTLLCLLVSIAAAQTAPPFLIRAQVGQNVSTLANDATLGVPADAIGLTALASLTITYRGTSTVTINTSEFSGSLDFSVAGVPDLPVTLNPNDSLNLSVRFRPSTSQRLSARLVISYAEGRTSGTVSVNFSGTAPEFAYSYIPQGGNATLIATDGTILFPATAIDATSTTTVILINRGSGPGVVNSISATGSAFVPAGLPLPATSVDAGRELRFTLNFTPKQLETSTGSVTIELVDRRVTFNLAGSGTGPLFAYDVVVDSGGTVLLPNGQVSLADAVVGDKSSVVVRVRNTGNADGRILAIAVQGAGFSLGDLPFLPLVLTPGASATFTLTFTPTAAGRATGRLRIGDSFFDVTGNGLGAILNYAYLSGPVTTTVAPNGTVIFTPVAVGNSTSIRFQIGNTGTAAAAVSSISLSGTTTIFALTEVPNLPVNIEPNAGVSFTVAFIPNALGTSTATLRVDNQSFTLSGAGNPPAALPQYTIEGPAATQDPLQQPAVRLTLGRAYPLPLNGTLTLAFNSDVFANDPAVQFATGGRTVNFTVPANRTQAVFPDGSNQIRLQTGTVAGTITLTPSFVTEGGINLTPTNPPALNLTVPQSAPRLLNVVLSAKTVNSVTLLVTGFATSRSVTQLDFTFTPVSGENVQTTRLSMMVEPSFLAFYQTTASQQFGSQFTATVPFTFTGDVKNVTTLADTIQSIAVTIVNRQGTSNSRSVDLR